MIASFDILSQHFADNDPYSVELKTMAKAASEMTEEEFELHLAADTFPCPTCGTKVLSKTKFCVKCKKKVEPKGGSKEAADGTCKGCGKPMADCTCPKEGPKEACYASIDKKASDAFTNAVRRTLIAEVCDDDDADDKPAAKPAEPVKTADQNSPHPQMESQAPAAPAVPPVEEKKAEIPSTPPAPIVEAKKEDKKPEEVPAAPAAPAAPVAPAMPAPMPAQVAANGTVNTDVLSFDGIGLTSSAMTDEDTVMTAEEQTTLASIMGTGGFDDMNANEKTILEGLLKK